jgi:serpin B
MTPSAVSRRKFLTLSAAAGAAAAAGGFLARSARACPLPEIEVSAEEKKLAGGINAFGLDLQSQLAGEKGSLFISPLSISTALAMTAAGARGETLAEMAKVLHLPKEPHPVYGEMLHRLNRTGPFATRLPAPYELSVANAIWAQTAFPWRKEFAELTRTHYGTGLEEVDFGESEAARKRINDWVADRTHDRIKELIGSGVISSLTRMVLANAVYFKSDWRTRFDKKETREEPFTRDDGSTVKAPLMHLTSAFRYAEFELDDPPVDRLPSADDRPRLPVAFIRRYPVQALELPYAGGGMSMLVFLPRDPRRVRTVAGLLTPAHFAIGHGAVEWDEQKVDVALPRFKVESKYTLNKPLMDLGMKRAFGAADFTGMSPRGKDLFISHVLHKAFVEVNEEGSEAAAATAVVLKERVSAPKPTPVFRADRPFVFAIRDNKSGAVLFLGRYDGPKA